MRNAVKSRYRGKSQSSLKATIHANHGVIWGKSQHRPLSVIAAEIRTSWKKVHGEAEPYLAALEKLHSIHDKYGGESAIEIVSRLRWSLRTWKGLVARRIKRELDAILKEQRRK